MMETNYQQMEQEHVQKIEQAITLLNEVLAGEKKEAGTPTQEPSLREELTKAMK